jgi:hypothetical protein
MLALLLAACGDDTPTPVDRVSESGLAAHEQLAKDILRELIEIDTTQTGSTTVAAESCRRSR